MEYKAIMRVFGSPEATSGHRDAKQTAAPVLLPPDQGPRRQLALSERRLHLKAWASGPSDSLATKPATQPKDKRLCHLLRKSELHVDPALHAVP